jgi:hypothetical protein
MSLSISGIGATQPVYAPSGPVVPYAPSSEATTSVAVTTTGTESGAAAVVYEPGPSDTGQHYTYSNRSGSQQQSAPQPASSTGDEAVVAATGGTVLPPPELPETPRQAEVRHLLNDVWAPVGPINIDPAAANAGAYVAPAPVGQAEASAQASYSAVADAQVAGASLSDLPKFA